MNESSFPDWALENWKRSYVRKLVQTESFSTKRRGTFERHTHVRVNSAPTRVTRKASGFDRHVRT